MVELSKGTIENERALFEGRVRQMFPGINLEKIGDKYNALDTQWKFEVWLAARAASGIGKNMR